jgi:anhydro-N-acetylmuramic acid kinase
VLQDQLPEAEIVIPDAEIITFKEAIIFAFLGVLRYLGQPNCLSSVTGALADNSGGAIWGEFAKK